MENYHYSPGDISFIYGKFRQKLAMRTLFPRAAANLSQTFVLVSVSAVRGAIKLSLVADRHRALCGAPWRSVSDSCYLILQSSMGAQCPQQL